MQFTLTKLRIKPSKVKKTALFLKKLQKRQKEMCAVLKEAGIILDCSFLDGNHLYIFKKMKSLSRLKKKIKNSDLPIYEDIREWMHECLTSRKDFKALASFEMKNSK